MTQQIIRWTKDWIQPLIVLVGVIAGFIALKEQVVYIKITLDHMEARQEEQSREVQTLNTEMAVVKYQIQELKSK